MGVLGVTSLIGSNQEQGSDNDKGYLEQHKDKGYSHQEKGFDKNKNKDQGQDQGQSLDRDGSRLSGGLFGRIGLSSAPGPGLAPGVRLPHNNDDEDDDEDEEEDGEEVVDAVPPHKRFDGVDIGHLGYANLDPTDLLKNLGG